MNTRFFNAPSALNLLIVISFSLCFGPVSFAAQQDEMITITQSDEDTIAKLASEFKPCADKAINPFSSRSLDIEDFEKCDAFGRLGAFNWKLIPYLIRQIQVSEESDVFVGSALAQRKITSLDDLQKYQKERAQKLFGQIAPFTFDYWGVYALISLTSASKESESEFKRPEYFPTFSWVEWWEKNKDRYEFRTARPLNIDTREKFYRHPHISTTTRNGLLDIHAVSATYKQIIERAAAEMGVDVYIGELESFEVITNIRMRSVSFDEFTYLLGFSDSGPFKYRKEGAKYHFGGDREAKSRSIMKDWGIRMNKTVFHKGDKIPISIITEGTGKMINPKDPVFPHYGSFMVTDNDGNIIRQFNRQNKLKPTRTPIYRKEDGTEIELDLSKYVKLSAGEYNITFKYLENVTPPIALEIYK